MPCWARSRNTPVDSRLPCYLSSLCFHTYLSLRTVNAGSEPWAPRKMLSLITTVSMFRVYVDVAGSAGQGFNALYDKDLSGEIG